MKTKIGTFDPETGTVPVIFSHAGIAHKRPVNACLDGDGSYDPAATKLRVADVALGVVAKIEAGAIK